MSSSGGSSAFSGPTSVRNAAGVIVLVTVLVVVAAGFLITVLDREEYPSLSCHLWWALQTVTTVGYGDVTPTNVSGSSWPRR